MAEKKEETKTLFQKLLQLQSMNITVEKNGKNSYYKDWNWKPSSYVVLDDIMNAYKEPMSECWLVVYNFIQVADESNYVVTRIVDADNNKEYIENIFPIAKLWDPQKMWSAISYWKRYNIWALLCIWTEVDADGNDAPEIKKVALTSQVIGKVAEAIKSWNYTKTFQECIDALTEKYIVSDEQKKIIEWLYTKVEEIVEEVK